jgi:hypothetical protein
MNVFYATSQGRVMAITDGLDKLSLWCNLQTAGLLRAIAC